MADVGNGVTLTTTFFTASVVSIQLPLGTREAIETSHLGTVDYRTFMPQNLVDAGELSCVIQYDGATTPASITGGTATLTVAVPAPPGSTATNTVTATAFVIDAGTVSITNDDLMEATVTMKLTGAMTHV
jgi:hypothetical protein